MASRDRSVHVATTRRKYKDKVYETHLLRSSYREGDKVKHETLGNLSHLPPEAIEAVRLILKGETLVSATDKLECVRSLRHGHVAAVLGVVQQLELDTILAARPSRERQLTLAMIVARILDPASKLAISRSVAEETADNTLGEQLGVVEASDDEFYAAMDWLAPRQAAIEAELARRHLDNSLILYDVTSTYFEGSKCPLAKYGHSRDDKPHLLQIVIGLICNAEGCPIAVEVFEGNTGDPTTLKPQIEKIRARFGLERFVIVADRGLITEARIREDLAVVDGVSWITSLRAPSIQELQHDGKLERSLFDEVDLAEITSEAFPGERLVACFNLFLAGERARKREALLAATERKLARVVAATTRAKGPLRGAAEIGVRVGKILGQSKVAKHFTIDITDDSLRVARDTARIEQEAALDGIYVVRTNVSPTDMGAEDVVRAYKSLSHVERAFRTMKTVDLHIRPIHHRREDRVRTHVFLCMLSYYVEWHLRRKLAPILFEDDDRAAAEARRGSVVASATRSAAADDKAQTKQTADGHTVMSFRDALQSLSSIAKNWMRPHNSQIAPFAVLSTPRDHQRRALELLGVTVGL